MHVYRVFEEYSLLRCVTTSGGNLPAFWRTFCLHLLP